MFRLPRRLRFMPEEARGHFRMAHKEVLWAFRTLSIRRRKEVKCSRRIALNAGQSEK